ncbi:ComEC/Rec2 family competence protein [Anaerocellum danielii]|uniref:ComEC/Rec2 family competence protein n=1 Tax=Anaerocellum danielii TaxID=1387557 RepID=A0ABZ0TXI5_9FIRM|nr:ComEC/Rec2 family competence protein [Caldicellulosiruptor danielii]WPX08141.1 ComEC/Rec2 family competence protein [Caldicellulosiruptor danielii]
MSRRNILSICLLIIIAFIFSLFSFAFASTQKNLTVSFIDVGQGDSILIQTPQGKNILVDSGPNTAENTVLNFLKSRNIKKLDVIVATHPHEDHIGNMDVVIKNFNVGKVYAANATTNTKAFESFLLAVKEKGLKITVPDTGQNISPDSKVKITVLSPSKKDRYDDLNDYSIVLKVEYGKTSFLLMGDATANIEEKLLHDSKLRQFLKADVLKVGHHGSKYSSTSTFLSTVKPKYAIISVGKDNPYGHPAAITISKLKSERAEILRTDQQGTITVTSDGQTIKIDKKTSAIKPQAPPSSSTNQYAYIGNSNTKKFHYSWCT